MLLLKNNFVFFYYYIYIYRYEKAARRLCQFLLLLYYYVWGSVGANVSQNNSFLTSLINYFSLLNSKIYLIIFPN